MENSDSSLPVELKIFTERSPATAKRPPGIASMRFYAFENGVDMFTGIVEEELGISGFVFAVVVNKPTVERVRHRLADLAGALEFARHPAGGTSHTEQHSAEQAPSS